MHAITVELTAHSVSLLIIPRATESVNARFVFCLSAECLKVEMLCMAS